MIAGTSIETVLQGILHTKEQKRDYIADTRALEFTEGGLLRFSLSGDQRGESMISQKEYRPTALCLAQIGERLNIPAKYVQRMASEAPELLAKNFNHWFANRPEKRMLRALENGSNVARAFLSNAYRPLENIDIAAHVLPKLQAAGCQIKSSAVTDTRLYIQAIIPRLEKTVAKVGDVVQSGVVISNSEVGCGSLWIEHMIYTLRCTNGMIGENVVKQAHVGKRTHGDIDSDSAREYFTDATRAADDRAFWLKVSDLVGYALSPQMFDAAVAKLDKTAGVEIEKPAEVIEVMSEKFDWQDKEAEAVLNHFIKGGRSTQYGLLNAITRTAEDLEDYDRAVEFERMGGKVMLLPASEFSVN